MHQLTCAMALMATLVGPPSHEIRLQKVGNKNIVLIIPENATARISDADGKLLVSGRTYAFNGEGVVIVPDQSAPCGSVKLSTRPNGFTVEPLFNLEISADQTKCPLDKVRGTYANDQFFDGSEE